ncbi:hypothetical protein ACP4OV_024610 [Aristida adscensionis]
MLVAGASKLRLRPAAEVRTKILGAVVRHTRAAAIKKPAIGPKNSPSRPWHPPGPWPLRWCRRTLRGRRPQRWRPAPAACKLRLLPAAEARSKILRAVVRRTREAVRRHVAIKKPATAVSNKPARGTMRTVIYSGSRSRHGIPRAPLTEGSGIRWLSLLPRDSNRLFGWRDGTNPNGFDPFLVVWMGVVGGMKPTPREYSTNMRVVMPQPDGKFTVILYQLDPASKNRQDTVAAGTRRLPVLPRVAKTVAAGAMRLPLLPRGARYTVLSVLLENQDEHLLCKNPRATMPRSWAALRKLHRATQSVPYCKKLLMPKAMAATAQRLASGRPLGRQRRRRMAAAAAAFVTPDLEADRDEPVIPPIGVNDELPYVVRMNQMLRETYRTMVRLYHDLENCCERRRAAHDYARRNGDFSTLREELRVITEEAQQRHGQQCSSGRGGGGLPGGGVAATASRRRRAPLLATAAARLRETATAAARLHEAATASRRQQARLLATAVARLRKAATANRRRRARLLSTTAALLREAATGGAAPCELRRRRRGCARRRRQVGDSGGVAPRDGSELV